VKDFRFFFALLPLGSAQSVLQPSNAHLFLSVRECLIEAPFFFPLFFAKFLAVRVSRLLILDILLALAYIFLDTFDILKEVYQTCMPKFNKMKRKKEIEERLQQIDEEFRLLGEEIKSASKMMAKIERDLETIENALSEEQKKTEKKKVSEIKRRIHASPSKSR